jgi:hypothetical protein
VEVVADDIDEIQQAYAAGLVEGHLTKSLIDMHWQNTIGDYCHNQKDFCQRLMIFLKKNYDWMTKQITNHHNDTYWKQVRHKPKLRMLTIVPVAYATVFVNCLFLG